MDQFIQGLPDSYQTCIGENGLRLSGGQRQRLGIARALYRQIELIVFDGATSALETETERRIMDAIDALPGDLTLISVVHRLSTLKDCTQISKVDDKRIWLHSSISPIFNPE